MARRVAGKRTLDLMEAIRTRIATRALAAGDRLPSVRSFAATMGVSPSTVVDAYDRLAAEGLIRAQRGSGFFVSGNALQPLRLSDSQSPCLRAVDPFWVSRQSLDSDEAVLKPGCGWLPADWMPNEALRRAMRALARGADETLAYYGSTRGSPALRRILLNRLAEEGMEAQPAQLILAGSGTQALDLVCRFVLRPGDTVLIDDPCYFNFRALLGAHQVKIMGVPYTPSGPDVQAFEALLNAERPRIYITNSALHNPTGATLSPQSAHRLLKLAVQHDLIIVEDDIFADFEPSPSTRLATLDGLDRVIRIGSFSKTLSASVRCGYVAARADWIEGLVDLQVATNFGGPSPVAAELIAHVLAGGGYRKHMDEVRQRLVRARREVAARLHGLGMEPWLMPRGGFNLWCRLPEGLDSTQIAQSAREQGIVLAPGNVFSVSHGAGSFFRFNVAHTLDPRIYRILADVMKDVSAKGASRALSTLPGPE
ncbi:DNA-binding transcriptional MocR family regulator [Rhizobium subbaraonis]|uniref:DNA-binding transcriptional MocR family regulator n=1 Tax=Rhizobium subbaraonis TaxID=908946 RepID=A0A285UEE4_9HYPH|nr:PLP-dependent aminotransferase family protein [Rhizobium subbaraonis]SOC39748.1 DNA-binding transcriptional MocR family regulator [Rhizobium subbaraonis]